MGRDSYPTPLYAVSSDIKKVGGDAAYLGMVREGEDGKQYKLVQSYDLNNTFDVGKLILGFKGGQAYKVILAASGGRCNGVAATTKHIGADDYFWMQSRGRADNIITDNGAKGSYLKSEGSGVGALVTLISTVTHAQASDADFTLNNVGILGWCVTDAVTSLISVDIDPGFVWEGTGTPLSSTYGDDA